MKTLELFDELNDLTNAIKMTREDLKKMRAKRYKIIAKLRESKDAYLLEKHSTATKF
jgi:hypothetical protein